jgi:hypothetical protein
VAFEGTKLISLRSARLYCVTARGVRILEGRAKEYRRLARDCLALATTIATEEARRALVEMARVWSRLADEVPPPLVQQQQQVQPKQED